MAKYPQKAICAFCKKPFIKKTGVHIYCSDECRHRANFGSGVCPICGKTFDRERPKQKYCSKNCKTIDQMRNKREQKKKPISAAKAAIPELEAPRKSDDPLDLYILAVEQLKKIIGHYCSYGEYSILKAQNKLRIAVIRRDRYQKPKAVKVIWSGTERNE